MLQRGRKKLEGSTLQKNLKEITLYKPKGAGTQAGKRSSHCTLFVRALHSSHERKNKVLYRHRSINLISYPSSNFVTHY